MARARRQAIPEDVKKQAEAIVDAFNRRVIRDPNRYERNRFELSYATRLNRAVGLYFGWRP